jgi:hypothetical protein
VSVVHHEPGSTRPGRALGLVLIGIAVIAAVLGVITLIDGGITKPPDSAPPSSQPGGTASQPPGTGGSQPPGSGSQPQPPQNSQSGSNTATPPPPPANTTTVPPPPPAQPPPDPRQVEVRVLNNGTVTGLAAQAARDFRNDGWKVVEVGNYSQGIIPTTTAYFRPGTLEEAAARALADKFNMRAEARFPGIAGASSGVIVMITNDYGGK